MRRMVSFCLFLAATASSAFAQLKYDAAKLVYTSDAKGRSIDETGVLFNDILRKSQPIVLFIHGRGDEPQKSLRGGDNVEGKAVQKVGSYGVKVVMYNWDSKAASGKDRQRPLGNMPAAQERFGMVLDKLGQTLINLEREGIRPPIITLLAHSMGTVVVQRYVEANNGWRTPGGRPLFTSVVLSSSDAARAGHASWVDKIAEVERRVFITVNSRDFILGQSRSATPPNPSPLGKDDPGSERSAKGNVTYATVKSLNHEIFNTNNGRPFFTSVFAGRDPQTNAELETVLPKITEFKATPTRVVAGLPVVLSWITRNARQIRIDPGDLRDARGSGSLTVRPLATTTYRLTAIGDAAQIVSNPVTVEVIAEERPRQDR